MADEPLNEGEADYASRVLDALQADLGYQENPVCTGCGLLGSRFDVPQAHRTIHLIPA